MQTHINAIHSVEAEGGAGSGAGQLTNHFYDIRDKPRKVDYRKLVIKFSLAKNRRERGQNG